MATEALGPFLAQGPNAEDSTESITEWAAFLEKAGIQNQIHANHMVEAMRILANNPAYRRAYDLLDKSVSNRNGNQRSRR